ncbi:DUF4245 domain-containing protein [Streptacidiphilus sp. N1-12]|uniref:DUF4245 domain-containing protein n=2 Tax=Streptacidiphilus alkalitolerans TaxID=3342712 RepID=A0ABV6X4K0_9ACTN
MATQSAPAQTGTAAAPAPKRRGMANKSARDMVLSMILVMAAGVVIYLFIPHSGGDGVHPVEYNAALQSARRAAPYPVLAPEGLAKGWNATAVEYDGADPADAQWTLGFIDPAGQYVAVRQSNGPAADFLADATTNGVKQAGTSTVDGTVWSHYQGDRYRALVLQTAKGTTAVTGTESFADLARFAAKLK